MRRRPPTSRHSKTAPPGRVRIVAGKWRRRFVEVADLPELRPTSGRIRETLFNWLAPCIEGSRCLDLFAGTGVLGLEALSRGAREALLVERDARLAAMLTDTGQRLHAEAEAHVVRADALAFLRAPLYGRFDIVFVDPPFADDVRVAVVAALDPWLADAAWLYLESPDAVDPGPAWRLHRESRTRDARHALYRRVVEVAPG